MLTLLNILASVVVFLTLTNGALVLLLVAKWSAVVEPAQGYVPRKLRGVVNAVVGRNDGHVARGTVSR